MIYTNWYGFDTENDEKGVVTLSALVDEFGHSWVWKKAGKFREWCDVNEDDTPVVICHNLEYDLVNEFGAYYPYLNLVYLDGRLISAGYKHVRFLDSFNHYRMSLKKIGEAFGIKKLEFDIHSTEYVTTDSLICLRAMTFTRDYVERLGGRIGATAGSTAMSVWRYMTEDEYLLGPIDSPWLRAGYYGGRTELFASKAEGPVIYGADGQPEMHWYAEDALPEWEEEDQLGHLRRPPPDKDRPHGRWELTREKTIKGYDVNSMYPYCMLSPFPIVTAEDPSFTKFKGMIECTVSVPHSEFVGPLPWRDDGKRLVYPVGVFRGTWTYDEVRYAQSRGTQIIKIHKAVGGDSCERPFDEFINVIYKKRKESTNPAEREVLKVILNSLYGKLASRSSVTRVVSRYELIKKGHTKKLEQVKWIDHNRGLLDFHTPPQKFVNVLWGAMVTANARILLTKHLNACPPEKLIYCDTDALYVNNHELPLSTELGGLKLEKHAGVMKVIQPKAYQIDEFFRAKGVPRPKTGDDGQILIDFSRQYIEEGLAEFQAPLRFRASIGSKRGKANQWIKQSKGMKTKYSAKKLSGNRYFPPVIGLQGDLFTSSTSKGIKPTKVK